MSLNQIEAPAEKTAPVRIVRDPYLAQRVVFIGGHPGCGKSLLTSILGSLDRVEIQKYNYTIEHLCCLYHLGTIDDSSAVSMIRMITDLDLYHMSMSRETNFRPGDLSSVFQNPDPWRYIRRLFQPGDAATLDRIREHKPIMNYLTHNLLVLSPLLFKALGDRVRILEVIRHPLYMIKQWYVYVDRYGTDVRDFTIWVDYHGRAVPFFASGWEEKYLGLNTMDKVIYSIEHLTRLGGQTFETLSPAQKGQVMILPFEHFVLNPWPYLHDLEGWLGTRITQVTRRELKRQNVPRKMIAQGIPKPIYRRCGWEPPERGSDEAAELEKRRQFAVQHATPEGMRVLDRMGREYDERIGSWRKSQG